MKQFTKLAMLILLLMLAACGADVESDATAIEPNTAEPTEVPTAVPTAEPTAEPTPEPTATDDTPVESEGGMQTEDDDGPAIGAPSESDDVQTYFDEAFAISFDHPADWFVEDLGFFLVVSNIEFELVEESDNEVGMFIAVAPVEEEGTIDEQFEEAMDQVEDGSAEGITLLEEPEEIVVDGKRAWKLTASIEEDGSWQFSRIILIESGDAVVSFVSFAPFDSWEDHIDVLDAILLSAEIGQPDFNAISSRLLEESPDEDDDEDKAPPLNIASNDITEGVVGEGYTIQTEQDAFITFGLSSGVTYYVLTQPVGDGDITLALFDEAGNELDSIDENGSGATELLPFTPDEDGDFTLQVGEYFGEMHAFNLQVLEIGQWDSAEISAQNDIEHIIEFEASTSAKLLLVIPPDDMDVGIAGNIGVDDISLYADLGYIGVREVLVIPPLANDDRDVAIWSTDTTGTVEFALIELDDVFVPAAPAAEVQTDLTEGVVGTGYTIQANADTLITFDLSGGVEYFFLGQALGKGDVELTLFAESGIVLERVDETGYAPELLRFTPDEDGEFTLRVRDAFGDALTFNLQAFENIELLSAELNAENDHSHTVPLAPSTSAQLLVAIPTENLDVDIDVYTPAFGVLFNAFRGWEGESEVLVIPPSDSTDRNVSIYSDDTDGTVAYAFIDLDDAFLPVEAGFFELDNAEMQTTVGQTTLTHQLSFSGSDSSAVELKFSGQAFQDVAIRIDPDDDFDATLDIFNGSGVLLLEVDDAFSGQNELLSLRIDSTSISEYVLKVDNSTFSSIGGFSGSIFHDAAVSVQVPGQGTISAPLSADAPLRYRCFASGRIPLVAAIGTTDGEVDASLTILDEAGEIVVDANEGGLGEAESALLLEPSTQLYTIVATALEGSASRVALTVSCSE